MTLQLIKQISIYTSYKVTTTEYIQIEQFSGVVGSKSKRHRDKGLQEGLDILIARVPCLEHINKTHYIQKRMNEQKIMHYSHNKKPSYTNEETTKQNYQSLDKLDRKHFGSKLSVSLTQKKNNGNVFKNQEEKQLYKGSNNYEEWPPTNKRRYLKNYQLPKINSPNKAKKEEVSRYDLDTTENLIDDEQKLSLQKKAVTIQLNSPTKKKLTPIKIVNTYPHVIKTKAGTTGKQTKINQDIAIVQEKFPHGIKLYCVCDGHGLNGHLVTAFIKNNLIKNLNSLLKKYHNPPDRDQFVELGYIGLQTTNQQLLDSQINTQLAGSTVIAVFIYQQKLYCFNVGDSRAILLQQIKTNFCKEDDKDQKKLPTLSYKQPHDQFEWTVFPLSQDQKPDRPDQMQKIIKSGGRVFAQTNQLGEQLGPVRVWMKDVMMPGLAMTRSFGDKAGIKAGTNAQPEMLEHTLTENDKLMVIASDGVWEYLQNEQVMKVVVPGYLKQDLMLSGEMLLKRSVQTWSRMNFARDDITLIVVKLNQPEKRQK